MYNVHIQYMYGVLVVISLSTCYFPFLYLICIFDVQKLNFTMFIEISTFECPK